MKRLLKPAAKFAAIPELAKGTYVLKGGTIHQPGKPAFVGTVVVDAASKKIKHAARTGENLETPDDATIVDCTGLIHAQNPSQRRARGDELDET